MTLSETLLKSIFGKKKRKSLDMDKHAQYIIDDGFIPYVSHFNKDTIITKNGELLQIIRVTGFGEDNVSTQISSLRDSIRESIEEKACKTNMAFWFTTIRRKKDITPPGTFTKGFSKDFSKEWADKNDLKNQYVNELYISFIIEGLDTSISNASSAIKSLSFGATKKMHHKHLEEAHKELNEVSENFLADIKQYGAKKLGIIDWEGILYSEPMRFFGKIINLYEERYPLAMNDISEDLASHIIAFGDREIEVVGHHNKNYATMLSLKEYSEVSTQHLDHILQLPFEFIITQSYDFCVDEKELEIYKNNDYILQVSGDEEFREISGLSTMTSENKGNHETDYTKTQTTISLIAHSKEELQKDLEDTLEHFHDLGLMVIREDIFMEHCFWSQLPANFSFLRRQKVVETELIGGFAALHSYPCGSIDGNQWGSAVSVLKTVLDTPYYFNFHQYNSGHNLIVGPDNSGKTILTNFLLSQAQRFDPRIYVIDSSGKSECFIKCLDGKYDNYSNKLKFDPTTKVQGINLSEFYEKKSKFGGAIYDLLGKFEKLLDDEKMIIVFDDIFNCLDDESMAIKFAKFLTLADQKNCVVIIKTSDINTISDSEAHKNIMDHITNSFYLPDPFIEEKNTTLLNITNEESALVKIMGQNQLHNMLLKCGSESIIFDFDLNPLTEYIDIFSNSELTLSIFNKLIENKTEDSSFKASSILEDFKKELKEVETKRIQEALEQEKTLRDEQRRSLREKMGNGDD